MVYPHLYFCYFSVFANFREEVPSSDQTIDMKDSRISTFLTYFCSESDVTLKNLVYVKERIIQIV